MRSHTLRYTDGDFTIVLSPTVLDANNQFYSRQIRIYHQALQDAIAGQGVWPPEQVAEGLYQEFRRYYEKLGALFQPAIDVARLEPLDRHLFFVCTEPVEHPDTGKPVAGLSGLEQLMGYRYSAKSGDTPAPPRLTTGDNELDVLVDTMLLFKRNGLAMARLLSVEDLALSCVQANNRMKTEQQGEDGESSQVESFEPPYVEDERFVEGRDRIAEGLGDLGVWVPEGF